ncbi:MAG: DUF2206 domain-containing protein [Methanophagales archaeon]|nr:DUF2206 domain-containing protein [Methanophagales archaeon]
MNLMKSLEIKKCILILIGLIFLTDLAILLNIPFLRQVLGFLFLTLLPGLFILQILKLDKLESTEKFVLSVGLSISFLMFFGLLLNNSLFGIGYKTPLSAISLLIPFNLAFIVLAIVGHKINKTQTFSLPNLNLSTSEKAFLIVPILFPALSIFGMHVMNTTDNNIILMFLLFLIPIYIAFVCFFNQKNPKRLYPVVIFLIGISLVLMFSLRSNHILGTDRHTEYYFFQTTLNNLHWSISGYSTLDACLSISILPTIYQSILNVNQEYLYKILIPVLLPILPLIIFIISKKYVEESYAFLASFFFMSQELFITCPGGRTKVAVLFFALTMMTLFNDKIEPLKKRILFIVFMASCIVSHYSTAYIFFFIMVGTFIGIEMRPKKYTFKKIISLTLVILFFSMIFFWYSQVTETAFNAGVGFIDNTLSNLNQFFVDESRSQVPAMFGKDIVEKSIPHMIQFVFTWLTFALIGIGIITLIRRYKEMSFPELNFKMPDFLKDKFEVEYFVIALVCSGLLVAIIALPFISTGYDIFRVYTLAITILSVFFVIGGIIIAKYLNQVFRRNNPFRKNIDERNASQVRAYLIILLVLIPYFLCISGAMYNIFGFPQKIILNSEGNQYDAYYVHDQESYGAKWLKEYSESKTRIYTDFRGRFGLVSQAGFSQNSIDCYSLTNQKRIDGYIYLKYYNVINNRLMGRGGTSYNLTEYDDVFVGRNNIYNNGGSEVYI